MIVAAASQEAWPEVAARAPNGATAGAVVERRQANAPKNRRVPHLKRCGGYQTRLPAFRLPFFVRMI
jgi:hypothetical protein